LIDVIKKHKPTVLLGVTAVGGLFTEELIREMASHVERPIIFPLSNPTTKAECTAEQAFEWTDGRCVFASGSPFDPVHMDDGRVFSTSQCNNMYIFPGLGLGATVCGAKTITDRMLYVAAKGKDVKMQIIWVIRDVGVWSGFSAHLLVFLLQPSLSA
jgi:malate dehydrogenase (oxaloacetate-decarboxylating)(NADP+)